MEEKKKSHQIFGRGSQVDSVGVYKANTAATLTLGPLNIALFELKKKTTLGVFARRLILVQISKVIPSIRALHGGEERRSEQTSPQANFTLHASVWAGGASFGPSLPGSESQEADGVAQGWLTHCKGGWTEQAKSDLTVQACWVGSGDPPINHSRHLKGSESIISTPAQKDIQNKPHGIRQGMGGGGKRVKCIRCHHPEQKSDGLGNQGPQCLGSQMSQRDDWMPNVARWQTSFGKARFKVQAASSADLFLHSVLI